MNYGNLDLSQLFGGQYGGGASLPTGSNSQKINPNMAPPSNFWEGDQFRIGAPGLQSGGPPQPQTPQPVGGMMKAPSIGATAPAQSPGAMPGIAGNASIQPMGGVQANPLSNPAQLGIQSGNSLQSLFKGNNPFLQQMRGTFA